MPTSPPLDCLGRRRSPASVPGYLAGRPPRSKGRRYPADPPRTEEIIAVMRCCGDGVHGARARGLIVVLWRAGRCPVELHQYAGASSGSVELVPDAGSSREALVARRDALRAAFAAWLRVRRITAVVGRSQSAWRRSNTASSTSATVLHRSRASAPPCRPCRILAASAREYPCPPGGRTMRFAAISASAGRPPSQAVKWPESQSTAKEFG
jgi:hypothetical protein